MKTCVRYCLAALLMAAMAIPLVGNSAKSADRLNSGKMTAKPSLVAGGMPVPWPKKPGSVGAVVTAPAQVAGGMPVPWPKKPGSARSV